MEARSNLGRRTSRKDDSGTVPISGGDWSENKACWIDTHRLGGIKFEKQGHDLVNRIRKKDVSKYTGKVITFVEGAAIGTIKFLFSLVLVIVVSIYMLLDMPRLRRVVDRRFLLPAAGTGPDGFFLAVLERVPAHP